LRIARAITTDSANSRHALVESGEATIRTAILVVGAPRIVLGIGARADPRDAGENRRHEEESLHSATPFGLPRIESLAQGFNRSLPSLKASLWDVSFSTRGLSTSNLGGAQEVEIAA